MSNLRSSSEAQLLEATDPSVIDRWTQLAETHWLKSSKRSKVTSQVVKSEIWDVLQNEGFEYKLLLALENLQILERYLWPAYCDDSTNYHVLLIVLVTTVKSREKFSTWNVFSDEPDRFSFFFRRVLSLCLDASLTGAVRSQLLSFLISAFQSLDNGLIRKECAPLVSISIWQHLHTDSVRELKFEQHTQLKKAWRAAARRYEAGDEAAKLRLRFERAWLYNMMLDFVGRLNGSSQEDLTYCERFLEFLTDLESQLPTRRYVNTLVQDLNLLTLIKNSSLFTTEDNGLFRDLFLLLQHFVHFSIDDITGTQYSQLQSDELHHARLAKLQRTALKDFRAQLTILALSNYGAIDKRQELEGHFAQLSDPDLESLCKALGLRINYPPVASVSVNRELLLDILISFHEKKKTFRENLNRCAILPTEKTIYEPSLLRNESYNGSRSLAIPKLNLQYLSVGDFLWRSFILHRCESFFAIRQSMEDTIKRLRPRTTGSDGILQFDGFSRMAIPISKPAIIEVAPPKVGFNHPAFVEAEIALDVSRLAEAVRREWELLRQDDVVYLLAVQPPEDPSNLADGYMGQGYMHEHGLQILRAAEVVQILDESGRTIREMPNNQANGHGSRPRLRRLIVRLDAVAYKADNSNKMDGKPDVYESINVVVRRKGRENNFKKILETIKTLALTDIPIPVWLEDVFLGFGDPLGAAYTRLDTRIKTMNFKDTFLDWQHLRECLSSRTIESDDKGKTPEPPYILEFADEPADLTTRPSKKRRRDEAVAVQQPLDVVKVSSYQPINNGPYPRDIPKINQVRFTPVQAEAIISGTQPGLTVIFGPPGTGKTDVATQIINNIYHNFPNQRTLLIAHSNQALNQLFQKIINLDIDERHLLRLGHGEEDLETEVSYSKHGRVESFLDNRTSYLLEVDRLAANFGAPGAHGNSCETAGYFNTVYILPAWARFWEQANAPEITAADLVSLFPFHQYFSNAPQPLFPSDVSKEKIMDIARGCQRHIKKIFTELEDIHPFEILRTSKDKTNYLMVKEARIIAMTSTHAAMRRQEISDLGFHYDSVVMEEAAQITEIENFIPLALQKPRAGKSPLQRVVLCGDHLQNSPIIQNLAFRQFANLEQSLFLRLVRLGVPTINLDFQGRSRPSIAELYKWRYERLENLPNVLSESEYLRANAGFRYDYQFIDVGDYKGAGESQPSPHFFQNLGEAEYAVAIYQYMRLLGYPASKISLLTTYAGQRALIRDVLNHRCAKNHMFGLPRIVTTVDKYQGEQNDYVILSLTRTNRVGYLRDIRRLTVALSRARLGLYILGRREVFENCFELRDAFRVLLQRPDQLLITTGELFPTRRLLSDQVDAAEMTGVEHLGQYVFEMSQAKLEAVRRGEDVVLGGTNGADLAGGVISDEDEAVRDVEDVVDDEGFEVEEEKELRGNGDDDKVVEEYPQ